MFYYRVVVDAVEDRRANNGWETRKGELLTPYERHKRFPNIQNRVFQPVMVDRGSTYYFFGCRYADEEHIKEVTK